MVCIHQYIATTIPSILAVALYEEKTRAWGPRQVLRANLIPEGIAYIPTQTKSTIQCSDFFVAGQR